MYLDGSLLRSQNPPVAMSSTTWIQSTPSHMRLGLPSGFLFLGLPTKIMYGFIFP